MLIGLFIFEKGPFIRPHPAFWKLVLGASVIYQIFLLTLLFQNKNDARAFFKHFDSTLGVKLRERTYASCCAITWKSIKAQLDIFVIAHVFGWYVKALLFRDYWICWILSIMFEFAEYSLEHQLPNFGECWWDHWLLDVAICNSIGIYFGMKTCNYFKMKKYNWTNRNSPTGSGCKEKIVRTLQQFTPYSWTSFEWSPQDSFKKYLTVLALIATVI